MTPREAQDGSGGAEGGSAVPVEGSGAQAGFQGVTEAPLLVRVRVNRPGEPERWVVGAISKNDPAIAAALAEERAKARAPFLAVIPEIQAIADDLGWAVGAHYAEVAQRIRDAAGLTE